jgi:hypothetical protein
LARTPAEDTFEIAEDLPAAPSADMSQTLSGYSSAVSALNARIASTHGHTGPTPTEALPLSEEPLQSLSLDEFEATPAAPAPPAAQNKTTANFNLESAHEPTLAFEEELRAPPPAPVSTATKSSVTGGKYGDVGTVRSADLASSTLAAPTPAAQARVPAPPAPVGAATSAASTPSTQSPVPTSAPMDRDFIARNQVVERYLSGRLPLKGATEFERFCRDNPELLDELGLPERVNAGLRLLEASGKPEPWQEAKQPFWQKPQIPIGLAVAVVALIGGLSYSMSGSAAKTQRIDKLQRQATERPLDPATSTREIRLMPSREGGSNNPAITIGGSAAQLADFKIDESRSPYKIFRVTIDRIDQGRVAVISELAKDSNGHLRIALNSSALGPGNYQLTIEGLTWRGDAEPDSWITIGIQH